MEILQSTCQAFFKVDASSGQQSDKTATVV